MFLYLYGKILNVNLGKIKKKSLKISKIVSVINVPNVVIFQKNGFVLR